MKDQIFGQVAAYTCMKEDQKRGLPHVHILLILAKGSKLRNGADVARVISAELPSQDQPELFSVIKRHNIHGPCGHGINLQSPCIRNGNCSKKFPKYSVDDPTKFTQEGGAILQRRSPRNGGNSFLLHMKNGIEFVVDNRWVVPYSPILSVMFNAHINVEAVSSCKSVKYIYKYTCKGSDKASFALTQAGATRNEVDAYQNGMYASASESFWRLYEFEIVNKAPPVMKLPLHLPEEQMIMFEPEEARAIVALGPPETKLTGFFKLCDEDQAARSVTYVDVPRRYRWDTTKKNG